MLKVRPKSSKRRTRIKPPKELLFPGDLIRWYRKHSITGEPKNYMKRPGIPIDLLRPGSHYRIIFQDLSAFTKTKNR